MIDGQEQQQEQQYYDTNKSTFSNSNYVNDSSFMRMRIDAKPLINQIKQFLGASEIKYGRDEDGNLLEYEEVIGKPLANKVGINRIVNLVQMIVNEQTVQGNITDDQYYDLKADIRKDIALAVVGNRYDWEIKADKTNDIINSIMNLISPYLTRLINNKERDSYGNTVQAREVMLPSQGQNQNMKGLGGLFR
jgi:hypothetical protein